MVYIAQIIIDVCGQKMFNRVLRELQEPDPGAGEGGLLQLAVCTGGLLLLVQQAR